MEVEADCSTWNQQEFFGKMSSNLELPENLFVLENLGGCSSTRRHLLADTITIEYYIEAPEGDLYFTENEVERITNDFSTGVAYEGWPDSLGNVNEQATDTTAPTTYKSEETPPPTEATTSTSSSSSDDDDSTVIIIGAACGAAALLGIGGFLLWRRTQKRVFPRKNGEGAPAIEAAPAQGS
eukprot:gene14189-16779_t